VCLANTPFSFYFELKMKDLFEFLVCIAVFSLVWVNGNVHAQDGAAQIPRDTTYTVASTYQKLVKQYPFIRPVQPQSFEDVRQVNDVVYLTIPDTPFGKRDLHADIFMPADKSKRFPGILMVHGGGWRSGDKSLNTPIAQHLAKNGFIVVSVEYRLSLEAKYPAAVLDLKNAICWMHTHAAEYAIDTTRIAVAGYSAGGQLASLLGVTQQNKIFEDGSRKTGLPCRIHAVVDMDGLLDFTDPESLAMKRTENSADVFWLQGFYENIPNRWKEASALTWVNRDSPPFLFINSSQTRFHAGCAALVDRLNQYGIYNEVHALEGAPHSYWLFHPWFDPTTKYIVDFLNTVLIKK
jgi:acetyl esterase/lipase